MKIIGITGLAGSGKSTIASLLKEKGYPIIDLDKLGHKALFEKDIKEKLVKKFGDKILENNEIQRSKLAQIVFTNKKNLDYLNSVVHPKIKEFVSELIEKYKKDKYEYVIIDGALIDQIGLNEICDIILLVEASDKERFKRLTEFRKMDPEKAKNIINAQKSLKLNYHYKINTEKELNAIKDELFQILKIF
ncbi:hypothetical protein XO10_00300 [Marinitoga sp. 1135]|uniref:Dephospho-CoA kinase n=1 Tax=Marinitoga piezophila (strain DSM 14283 / JCM 11233 / KA3) TaxID=443254 RepID=H2J2S4_MARPK|nr:MULTISPECIES: dephospho-CoA kinase [Marinitoga]AEX84518.1 dephospho-CoA kinase [Marinitoga piezophila KA3]NUU94767.1 hypothetical protein [Marinitoga sp. 1135]NUU96696.1 hypothetical protein [Marinitoga sp. 1138]